MILFIFSEDRTTTAEAEGEVRRLYNRSKHASNIIFLIFTRRYFCGGYFYVLVLIFVLLSPYVCFHSFCKVLVTEWLPIGKK